MARARNIKPGFFKNEDLAECSPWARLCFAGLWTLADREGRLEDRPKRIKGELFPFDAFDVEPLLAELVRYGFIVRYEVDGQRCIQVSKFSEHQTPHYTEKPSVIKPPQLQESDAPPSATDSKKAPGNEAPSRGGQNPLIPDSLIPDSPNHGKPPPAPKGEGRFPEFWTSWPKSPRKGGKPECLKVWQAKELDAEADAILAHVKALSSTDGWTKSGGDYVPAPVVYLRGRRWDGAELVDGDRASPVNGARTWSQQRDATIAGLTGSNKPEVVDVDARLVG